MRVKIGSGWWQGGTRGRGLPWFCHLLIRERGIIDRGRKTGM